MGDSDEDAREQVRYIKHRELRHAVVAGDDRTVRVLLEALGNERQIIVNMSPAGANTLLFLAAQSGFENIVNYLLDAGADGRLHSITNYSPLYIAVYYGHYNIAKILLDNFPDLIKQPTVEKWLPIHAASINGHVHLIKLLINYKYPEYLYSIYRDENGSCEWRLAFDPNAQDVTGQTSLYIASILGNKTLVNVLLKWKVATNRISLLSPQSEPTTAVSKGTSFTIQKVLSKLNKSASSGECGDCDGNIELKKCPINLNILCGAARETALLAAVRGSFLDVVTILLEHGANPNIMAKPVEDQSDPKYSEEIYGISNVPIAEACKQKSVLMLDLLLKYGARDDNSSALEIAIASKDEEILSRLLTKRVHPDSDYKINKKCLPTPAAAKAFLPSTTKAEYSAVFPSIPTIIDWHNKNSVYLTFVRMKWMVDAVLYLNPKLESHTNFTELALTAITRIDFSRNHLISVPMEIFQLLSLKYLNLAQNKITELPSTQTSGSLHTQISYTCPVLEELHLEDNQLTYIPVQLFHLPLLVILDISNNKLQEMPFDMWKAPKLRELNISFNLLKDLPEPTLEFSSLLNSEKLNLEPFSKKFDKKCDSLKHYQLIRYSIWSTSLEVMDNDITWNTRKMDERASQLSNLNIANNLFTSIPPALPCLASHLTRLNMSYNKLRSMGHVTSYPVTLKQLDLSHNEISCWPSLPSITDSNPNLLCYNIFGQENSESTTEMSSFSQPFTSVCKSSFRNTVLKSVCCHRRHLRLESLRTLILADNLLTRIQLSTDDVITLFSESDESDCTFVGVNKSKLIFPNLSMLDVSNNCLREVPPNMHELSSLSVLNISGNVSIISLPAQLGLLTRLWNLNTRGCLLQDPLKYMIESKKYKTMDILGYLKSIYEDAQPYARMKLMVVGVQGIGKTALLDLLKHGISSQKIRSSENHWAKRVGHNKFLAKTSKIANISTVGVDIGTWIFEKKRKLPGFYGPVTFRTWDFAGQKEYYATHQYFLSKRSLYLVLWKITDGHKGLAEVLQWLGNIQARAPNSSVIIVGTHYDKIGETYSAQKSEELQQFIREKFMGIADPEKVGLPRVVDSVEVSCKNMHNIQYLANIIYDAAFALRSPGSKEPLLLQKIPATYIALEDIVNVISCNLKTASLDPVLDAENFKKLVNEEMRAHNYKTFRDAAELNQATMFLHDNGVILHYEDATLRDYYFLDPQWLCDMLAHVVTVREINPFARTGIMKLDDLNLLFRSQVGVDNSNRKYIVSLLNKFEVALTWNARTLLIPSLLPLNEEISPNSRAIVKICPRVRISNMNLGYKTINSVIDLVYEPLTQNLVNDGNVLDVGLRRILLMTYFPSGFWSRLITRLLADEQISETIKFAYDTMNDMSSDFDVHTSMHNKFQWNLWQTGLALYYGSILIFKIWELPFTLNNNTKPFRSSSNSFKLKIDGIWNDINLFNSNILEVYFPLLTVNIYKVSQNDDVDKHLLMQIAPNLQIAAKLLALAVDHIDLLLEDWYPSLGTRFVHTSEGRFLITRLVACPKCLRKLIKKCDNCSIRDGDNSCVTGNHPNLDTSNANAAGNNSNQKNNPGKEAIQVYNDILYADNRLKVFSVSLNSTAKLESRSEDSLYFSDTDLGVAADSTGLSRNSPAGSRYFFNASKIPNVCYTWMVEECVLSVYNQRSISCPIHLEISMMALAPDVIFLDVPDKYTVKPEAIIRGSLLGRGAFGFVFKATYKLKELSTFKAVAMKMLQPISPGARANGSALMAYKLSLGKWDRDPLQYACKAYCIARQELAVLLTLKHPNIVPLVGICVRPLALVLELAPLGGLDSILRQYRCSGAHIGPYTFQILVLQAARAMEYLHRQRIIYRDLKAENVLVWCFPQPHDEDSPRNNVHIKIADYGISRQTAPNGLKGFGGTEGFMAPEIIRYNGEEEYTEKVDCFSFGMLIYEIITLRQPFEGHESIKECILSGNRPAVTQRELNFPTYCLDMMVLCWNELPKRRPSASQIVSILTAPECIHLLDIVVLPHHDEIICGAFYATITTEDEVIDFELWLPVYNSHIDILQISSYGRFVQMSSISKSSNLDNVPNQKIFAYKNYLSSLSRSAQFQKMAVFCCCIIEETIWMGDSAGNIHAYALNECTHVFSYMLDPNIKSPVINVIYLSNLQRVAVGLQNGRIFLLDAKRVPASCVFAEGSFVLTEICCGLVLHCFCALLVENYYELWCGELAGKMNVFSLNKSGFNGHKALYHSDDLSIVDNMKVVQICSNSTYVYTCLYPGYIVYQWHGLQKYIENKLDCSKLLPCSESLKSMAIDEHLSLIKCQISALCANGHELYIGTAWGCLIIVESSTLCPITVFRPYENEIKAIITIPNKTIPLIATVGRQYRSLISRYMDNVDVGVSRAFSFVNCESDDIDNHMHCLLWNAKDWT